MTSFATCTYQEMTTDRGIPVRTTVGFPRFALKYELAGHLTTVTPDRAMLKMGPDAYRDAYFAKLDRAGVDGIRDEAQRLRLAPAARGLNPELPVVVLCFDKLWIPGEWCHRTLFGTWWLSETGEDVPELGKTTHTHDPKGKPYRETAGTTLF